MAAPSVLYARSVGNKNIIATSYDGKVYNFGGFGNGEADDRPRIQDAIDWVGDEGGGEVYIPTGEWLLDSITNASELLVLRDYVRVRGDGWNQTKLIQGDELISRIFTAAGSTTDGLGQMLGWEICDMYLDGNGANQSTTGLHTIRGSYTDQFKIQNVRFNDGIGYHIGLQNGVVRECVLNNLYLENNSNDLIDIKADETLDVDIYGNKGCILSNVIAKDFSNHPNADTPGTNGNAAIDLRGAWNVSNVYVEANLRPFVGIEVQGFRLRPDSAHVTPGVIDEYGGRYSNVTNVYVRNTYTDRAGTGIAIGARANVSNLVARGCVNGLLISSECSFTNISNMYAEDCNNAVQFYGVSNNFVNGVVAKDCDKAVFYNYVDAATDIFSLDNICKNVSVHDCTDVVYVENGCTGNVTEVDQWDGSGTFFTNNTSSIVKYKEGVIHRSPTTVGTVGTGEDILKTFTLPGNYLATTGSSVRITGYVSTANNGNTKTAKLIFGATTLGTISATLNANLIKFEATVSRTGAATQSARCTITYGTDNGTQTVVSDSSGPTETLSGDIVISLTGEGTSDNDLVGGLLLVEII